MPGASVRIGDAAAAEKIRQTNPVEFSNSLLNFLRSVICRAQQLP